MSHLSERNAVLQLDTRQNKFCVLLVNITRRFQSAGKRIAVFFRNTDITARKATEPLRGFANTYTIQSQQTPLLQKHSQKKIKICLKMHLLDHPRTSFLPSPRKERLHLGKNSYSIRAKFRLLACFHCLAYFQPGCLFLSLLVLQLRFRFHLLEVHFRCLL